jgi:hypothetical protein
MRALATLLLIGLAAVASARSPRGIEIIVDAELIEPAPFAPGHGSSYVILIARYRIIKVIRGEYRYSEILVGQDDAPSLAVGRRQRLTLTSAFPARASLLDPFMQEALRRGVYYCKGYTPLH